MDFERRLNKFAALLSQHVSDSTVDEFRDFVDAREYGVAVGDSDPMSPTYQTITFDMVLGAP